MSAEIRKQRLSRLDLVFVWSPIYFVTACTQNLRNILVTPAIRETFLRFGKEGALHGSWIGAYLIMPNHLHVFVATDHQKIAISAWMTSLKNIISKTLRENGVAPPHWQKTFFDHLLRSTKSYSEKWNYVRDNPVRAGLVASAEDWPYVGEIFAVEYRSGKYDSAVTDRRSRDDHARWWL
jgi:REP-associated tyrosine transposase